uniref:Expressed conserved protein n=1 Tax=Echinococcus granulosus TaxID=6210 RepID=A0A068WVL1_ECHGR|nr:expressed conserved protein [Echinococcus granulosus]
MTNPTIRVLRRPIQVIQTNEENVLPAVPSKTLEEREAHYASVRRRIMGAESVNISSDSDEFIDSDISLYDSLLDDHQGNSDDTEKVQNLSQNTVTTTTSLPSPSVDTSSTKASIPASTAVPLMSIPTAALSFPTSLERDSHALNFILPSRMHQVPLLGAPQNSSLSSQHRHSDIPLSRGFACPTKMFNPLSSARVPPPQLPRSPLTSALPQSPAKPLSVHDSLLRQYQLLNWQLLHQSFQQSLQQQQQNHLHHQQQSFLPPPLAYESGIYNHHNFKQGILQGPNFFQPSSR